MNPFQKKLNEMLRHLSQCISCISNHEATLEIRLPSKNFVFDICDRATSMFSYDPIVLGISSPIVTVGDLHGHYLDLLRIMQVCGHPQSTKYIFLGDIVDRGEFSLETIIMIFLMKICYPTNVFVIRGNHEFDQLASKYGFLTEVLTEYQDRNVYNAFLKAFSQMPIAAVIDEVTICVHGGIGPGIVDIDTIRAIKRPIDAFSQDYTASLFWSDPNPTINDYQPSPRGTGFLFGKENLLDFLENSNAVRIVRGHEYVQEGYYTCFDDRVVTIFSASNYCGTMNNESAVLIMEPNGEDEIKRFPPLAYIKRSHAKITKDNDIKSTQAIGSSMSAGSVMLKSPLNPSKHRNHVTPALHRLQELNQKQMKMNQSLSLCSNKWTEYRI